MSECPSCGKCQHTYARPYSADNQTLWCFDCGAFLRNYTGHATYCKETRNVG